jgi:uncharacterized Tic20 family protein
MNTSPTTEERLWAVFSHLSALAFGMGLLLPIIGWSEQRRKSKYASFQCLQALGYQSLGYTVWILSYFVAIIVLMVIFVVALSTARGVRAAGDAIAGIWMVSFFLMIFGLFALYFLIPVIAAIACAFGADFRYPILGKRLARYLGYMPETVDEALMQEREERWVAAMGHFSIIIALWGILAPVTAWIIQGKHSAFLRFQSIQTTLYQAFVNVIFMGTAMLYLVAVMMFFAMTGWKAGPASTSPTSMPSLFIFGVLTLFATVIFLVMPLFHILGQWAGYRVLKGDNYQYPIIGKLTERRIANKTPVAEDGDFRVKALEGKAS